MTVLKARDTTTQQYRSVAVAWPLTVQVSVLDTWLRLSVQVSVYVECTVHLHLSFPATTRARSAVGPSLSLAQRSGTRCQTSSVRDPSLAIDSFRRQLKTFLFAD